MQSLDIDDKLFAFVNKEALPGTGVKSDAFWRALAEIVHDLALANRALLQKRDDLQKKIDVWNKANRQNFDPAVYKAFLSSIGYLVPEGRTSRSALKMLMLRLELLQARNLWCPFPTPALR